MPGIRSYHAAGYGAGEYPTAGHNLSHAETCRLYTSANRRRHAALDAGHNTRIGHWLMPRSLYGGTVSLFLEAWLAC